MGFQNVQIIGLEHSEATLDETLENHAWNSDADNFSNIVGDQFFWSRLMKILNLWICQIHKVCKSSREEV